jgi:hypothetical protein
MKRRLRDSSPNESEALNTLLRALSNYCGPGGVGPIRHRIDVLCKQHDHWYRNIDNSGRDSYKRFNEADVHFIKELKKIIPVNIKESILHKAALGYFEKFKKTFFPHDIQSSEAPDVTPQAAPAPKGVKRVSPAGVRKPPQRRAKRRIEFGAKAPSVPPAGQSVTSQVSSNMSQAGRTEPKKYKSAPYLDPDVVTRQLKWQCEGDIITVGSLQRFGFRCNSIFDPNISVTTKGDSKNRAFNGVANFATQYSYYRVLANQVKVHFLRMYDYEPTATTGDGIQSDMLYRLVTTEGFKAGQHNPVVCGVAIDPNNKWGSQWNSISSYQQYMVAKYNDIKYMTGDQSQTTISFKYNPEEWAVGTTSVEQEAIWTQIDKNPERQDFFTVFAQGLGTGNYPTGKIKIIVEMDAIVQFREWSLTRKRDMYLFDRIAGSGTDETFTPYQLGANAAGDLTADGNRNDVETQAQVNEDDGMSEL